jgi:hypothetical protein
VLITGIEEIFGEKIQEEYTKNLKPEQFQTVVSTYRDGIREFVNKRLKIVDYDLKNRWTVVSKNYYDFTAIPLNDIALFYATPSIVAPGTNAAFTGWFSPKFSTNLINANDYYLFGDNDALTGFKLTLSNTLLKLSVNGSTEAFIHGISLSKDKWYAFIVNINNSFMQLEVSIYSLDPNSNNITSVGGVNVLPQSLSNNLIPEFHENRLMPMNVAWSSLSNYSLRANDMYMTNIRVFNTPIEFEQHSNVLNQYVVRDNQLALIIDNAIPSLGFQKFANAR